jgi:hypothetical protein
VQLEQRHFDEIAERVLNRLAQDSLPAPLRMELEEAYTARVLFPAVCSFVQDVGLRGVLVAGDGGRRPPAVRFMGAYFWPDIVVSWRNKVILAVEVKLARQHCFQDSVATALGQSLVYRGLGGECAAVIIDIDARAATEPEDVERAGGMGVSLIVRRPLGAQLNPAFGLPADSSSPK